MEQTQIIIAGAGPVGTIAAYYLATKGINVVICEAGPNCAQDLRASTFHPPTLEMLDELGIADELIKRGLKAPEYHFRERQTEEVIEFDLSELSDMTKFPYRVQCEQHVLASMLAEKLEAHPNATVLFNHRVTSFTQNDDGVEVALETPYEMVHLKGKYLIAADGGNSIIRKWLNVEFEGFTYPEKFLTLSTKLELKHYIDDLAYVNYVSDPEEWLVLLRVPSVWRILVPASEDQSDEFLLSEEYKDDVFKRLTGETGVTTQHRTIYRVHQRVATKFNHGRVCLVGDSAHLNNPLGGFGMNSGIHDAWNLCEKLLTCLAQGHDPELLDLFDRQRRTVTLNFIQAQTKQNKALLEHGMSEGQKQRLIEMRQFKEDPVKRREFLLRQSMFSSLEDARSIK
ncbi:FAD-dependent oxidoreductase [Paraglaciecola sp. 2405UD69-4]|uniref:FAD-dependent oxidoreductase n=1 Tax=Paraglaciecola sp. 2405UD69-4 TaxID=3391836 RepID=UPI0039C8D1B0